METSDESFAWTDASSDSSKDMGLVVKQNKSEHHSDEGEASNEMPQFVQIKEKKRVKKRKRDMIHEEIENDNSDYQINRSIKSEPSSDFDGPKSNKRHKSNVTSINSNYNESLHEAEEYLNLRVKQEQCSFMEPTPVKTKKKKKCKVIPEAIENQELEIHIPLKVEIGIEDNHLDTSSLVNGELSEISEKDVSKRKKKKKKKKRSSVDNDSTEIFQDQDHSNKKKKKDKEIESNSNDDVEFQNGVNTTTSQIISSTLLNSFQDNDKEQSNNEILSVSTLLNSQESVEMEKKASRISDRIRYEDDSVDYQLEEYAPKIELSIQLKQFISSNNNLIALQANLPSNSVLSEDDEVWIVKGPHEISVGDFENTNVTLDSKQKVKLNGKTYDSIIDTSTCAVPILLYNKNKAFMRNMPLMGVIHLRKRIPKVHIPYESLMTINNENSFIPLPDTKCRHPLFGINYKKAIKIPTAISKQLNSSNASSNTDNKKKKVHKIKEKHEIESDIEVKPSNNVLHSKKKRKKIKEEKNEIESEKEVKTSSNLFNSKKKKQKLKGSPIQFDNEVKSNIGEQQNRKKRKNSEEMLVVPKKAKRVKLDLSSADAWESEQAIEKTLFDF
ncbi:jg17750 [Pararge aegeria aegeria]|uniref:Jg17750 protein n=1 Tax=Pararge aegeria aegeria TaxID=348720 RepID=A0A8S4S7S8_9NEOP|nr:jg17750 [Pararge aegeria aegeria]